VNRGKLLNPAKRRACAVVGQPRSTQRKPAGVLAQAEQHLRSRLRVLSAATPRYGYRRLHVLLARERTLVNHICVQRLYPDVGLRSRNTKRKRTRLGTSTYQDVATYLHHE